MKHPPISLANLSNDEKEKYAIASQKNMVKGITMYIIPFVVFGFLVWYVNMHNEKIGLTNPDVRSWVNVALVFLTILPARFFVNVMLRHRKATSAWQKKIFRGKIAGKEGNIITLNNQKIKLPKEEIEKVKVGDDVKISISTTGDFVFAVEPLDGEV
jgi:hypothetical protein